MHTARSSSLTHIVTISLVLASLVGCESRGGLASPLPTFASPTPGPSGVRIAQTSATSNGDLEAHPTPPTSTPLPCPDLAEQPTGGATPEGVLVLSTDAGPVFYDMRSGALSPIPSLSPRGAPELYPYSSAVSPSGKYLAYMEVISQPSGKYARHELRIISADAAPIPVRQGEPTPGEIIEWLDDARVAIASTRDEPGTLVVAYPFSSRLELLPPPFHDIDTYEHVPWSPYDMERGRTVPTALYSSDLNQVAYLRFTGNETGLSYLSVRDAETSEILWTGPRWVDARPTWLKPGHELLTTSDVPSHGKVDDLYLVRPGVGETQLTDLAAVFPSYSRVFVDNFTLAPDGDYVAFTVCAIRFEGSSCTYEAMLLSLRTAVVADLCQESAYLPPIWSPDSRYLIVRPDALFNIPDFTRLPFSLPGFPEAWITSSE